jgi:hypothetical protein
VRDILQYFAILDSTIQHSAAMDADVDYERRTPHEGKVRGTVHFPDGSRLKFVESVTIQAYRPIRQRYAYQYLRGTRAVFRYDNAPHHRGLPNFPHHKHVGRKVVGATEPTLGQVLKEIATFMEREGTE